MQIGEYRDNPMDAREIAMRCPDCRKLCYGTLPYRPTANQRLLIMRAAMDEHRRVCMKAPPEAGRTFELWYPRR